MSDSTAVTAAGRAVRLLPDITAANAAWVPDRLAVVDPDRQLTWGELGERTTRLANALTGALGLAAGDRIGLLGENCAEWLEVFHAAAQVGVVVVPLNDRSAVPDLEAIVGRTRLTTLLHTPSHAGPAGELTARLGLTRIGVRTGESRTFEALLDEASSNPVEVHIQPHDISSICFTSGTTGRPKGVVFSYGNLAEWARVAQDVEGFGDDEQHLFVRPIAMAMGHRLAAWHGLRAGTTVLEPRFGVDTFFRDVERHRITRTMLAPTTLWMLLENGNPDGHDLTSLRGLQYGNSPITPALLERALEFFGCDFHQVYGGTEAGTVLHLSPADHRAGLLASHGRPVEGVEVRLDDTTGELSVRSGQLMVGYFEDPQLTAAVLNPDGWFRTGDIAEPQGGGRYRIAGRVSDLIISGGYNVFPAEVERVLESHPAVSQAAVVGLPHPKWGEEVHAAVVLRAGVEVAAAELQDLCKAELASYKKPASVAFLPALPVSAAGKVAKGEVRAYLLAAHELGE